MEVLSKSPAQTKKLASDIARGILSGERGLAAVVLALEGELGSGKTTFVQGFARALGIKRAVRSPTFVLMKNYKLPARTTDVIPRQNDIVGLESGGKTKSYKLLYHIDCYRIRNGKDLTPLGIKEIFSRPDAIVLLEWPERARDILPKRYMTIHFDHVSERERIIRMAQ